MARDGRNARWDEHREQRKRLILDAAIEVVEAAPAGAELTLQDVADRAGLVRTVVQRHFGDRTGLVRAVQAEVLERAFALISGPVTPEATLRELATQMVGETVAWVDGHPCLHRLVEREVGDGRPSELSRAIRRYSDWLTQLLVLIGAGVGTEFDDRQLEEVRLLFTSVIGQVRAAVAQWAVEDPRLLTGDEVRDLLTGWIGVQIVGQAQRLGLAVGLEDALLSLARPYAGPDGRP